MQSPDVYISLYIYIGVLLYASLESVHVYYVTVHKVKIPSRESEIISNHVSLSTSAGLER